jgi:hypothetical protein
VEVLVSWDETEWVDVGDMSGVDEVRVGEGVEEVGCFPGAFESLVWPEVE